MRNMSRLAQAGLSSTASPDLACAKAQRVAAQPVEVQGEPAGLAGTDVGLQWPGLVVGGGEDAAFFGDEPGPAVEDVDGGGV